jgi:hypothetical protein
MNLVVLERKGKFSMLYLSVFTGRHMGAARTRDTSPAIISN